MSPEAIVGTGFLDSSVDILSTAIEVLFGLALLLAMFVLPFSRTRRGGSLIMAVIEGWLGTVVCCIFGSIYWLLAPDLLDPIADGPQIAGHMFVGWIPSLISGLVGLAFRKSPAPPRKQDQRP